MTKQQALDKILNKLSFSAKTTNQVRTELKKMELEEDVIEEIVDTLTEARLLNDYEFATRYVEILSQKYSGKRIIFEMMKKGLDKELCEQVIEESEIDNTDMLAEFVEKRINGNFERKNIDKVLRRFMAKGYEYRDIMKEIEKLKEDVID